MPFFQQRDSGQNSLRHFDQATTLVAHGGDMKRFLWLTPILFVLLSACAYADSIRIGFDPNDGSGDNFGFVQQIGGVLISGFGGTPADFFNTLGYAPGSTLGGSTDIFFSNGFITFGGNSSEVDFSVGTLFLSSFTLPTNGRDFAAQVSIGYSASGTILNTGEPLDVGGGASGQIKFHFVDGFYYADPLGFTQAPEPGTLGLMGTGLIGILALVRKRLRI
jgi:hypothetical protein